MDIKITEGESCGLNINKAIQVEAIVDQRGRISIVITQTTSPDDKFYICWIKHHGSGSVEMRNNYADGANYGGERGPDPDEPEDPAELADLQQRQIDNDGEGLHDPMVIER